MTHPNERRLATKADVTNALAPIQQATDSQLVAALSSFLVTRAEMGENPQGSALTVADRLLDIEASIPASGGSGFGGAAAELLRFGPENDTEPTDTGYVYGPFVAPVDYDILSPAVATLRGALVAASTDFDIELCSSGIDGPWTSIFAANKPSVAANQRVGQSGPVATTSLPALGALRMKVLSASSGGGGTISWRTPSASGNGATTSTSSLPIILPTGLVEGDTMVAAAFLPTSNTTTPTWPAGWTPYGSPFPAGTTDAAIGPFFVHLATKTATASEPTNTSVGFAIATTAVMTVFALKSGTLVAPTSANAVVNSTLATSHLTPPGLSTPADNCTLVHIAMPRWGWPSNNVSPVSPVTWTGVAAGSEAQAETSRTQNQNTGISITHETQAAAGAVTQRTASWTSQARSLTLTLVFKPSGGTPPTGPEVTLRVRPTTSDVVIVRDPLQHPFASTSPWNTPLGSGAVLVSAGLGASPSNQTKLKTDPIYIGMGASDPLLTLDDCTKANGNTVTPGYNIPAGVLVRVPAGLAHDGTWNGIAALLDQDGRHVWQGQPMYLNDGTVSKTGDGPRWAFTYPQPDSPTVRTGLADLYGDGLAGAHGASHLGGLGGPVRSAEWYGTDPIRHALALNVFSRKYLYRAGSDNATGFRWPAVKADSSWNGTSDASNNNYYGGTVADMKMGALVCLPPSFDLTAITDPQAYRILWTLKNFGAYIVDSTGFNEFYAISAESTIASAISSAGAAFHAQVLGAIPSLQVVTNNGPSAIGGGGTPVTTAVPAITP